MRARSEPLAALILLIVSSCGTPATPIPTAVPAAAETTAPVAAPSRTPGARPPPTETAAPPAVAIAEDAAFLERAERACRAAAPPDPYALRGPDLPAAKMSQYRGVHIAVLEMRGPDGAVGEPPPLAPGQRYWPAPGRFASGGQPGPLVVEVDLASDVDVFACVVLRTGGTRTYSASGTSRRVTALDAIVWMVDARTGAAAGQPWVVPSELSLVVQLDLVVQAGGTSVLPPDVRSAVAYFMGRAVPASGAVYHGGASGWVVAAHTVPLDLPDGSRLLDGHTFVVRLVALGMPEATIDLIDVLCAPNGVVGGAIRVATGLAHRSGTFAVTTGDVELSGDFISETLAVGEVRARSARASACGIPSSASWQAVLSGSARAAADGYELYLP